MKIIMYQKNNGFTLVEVSIVLLVVAFIVGAVLSADSIIGASKVRGVVEEVSRYQSAVESFKAKYLSLPGDMADATSHFSSSINGDGDDLVEWAGANVEALQAWLHLFSAEMYDGPYTGTGSDGVPGTNGPLSSISEAGYFFTNSSSQNYLGLGGADSTTSGPGLGGVIRVKDAFDLDNKLDDGAASTGRVRGLNGTGLTTCLTAGEYLTTTETPACYMLFRLNTEL